MVHQSRFDRLAVAFTYADGHIEWERVASGAFGTRWRVGGQVAFEAASRAAPIVSIQMRFDHVASKPHLPMRIVNKAEDWYKTALSAGLIVASWTQVDRGSGGGGEKG